MKAKLSGKIRNHTSTPGWIDKDQILTWLAAQVKKKREGLLKRQEKEARGRRGNLGERGRARTAQEKGESARGQRDQDGDAGDSGQRTERQESKTKQDQRHWGSYQRKV
jgi:hypothetical protein